MDQLHGHFVVHLKGSEGRQLTADGILRITGKSTKDKGDSKKEFFMGLCLLPDKREEKSKLCIPDENRN
jgi:hypothetical protein